MHTGVNLPTVFTLWSSFICCNLKPIVVKGVKTDLGFVAMVAGNCFFRASLAKLKAQNYKLSPKFGG